MTGYLAGEKKKYSNTKKSLPAVCFHFGVWRDCYNDMKHQEKGIYSLSTKDKMNMILSVESSEEMESHNREWEWLIQKIISLKEMGKNYIKPGELKMYLGDWNNRIKDVCSQYGVNYNPYRQGYEIDTYSVETDSLTT